MPPVVDVKNLEHVYPAPRRSGEPRWALKDVSFSILRGEIFGVLGPNGGGKTTLFRILSTALRASGGTVSVLGKDVRSESDFIREKLGVVFQSPSLDKKLTVMENLVHQGRLHGLSGDVLRQKIAHHLERVGMSDRSGEMVERLSGGLQRRVEIVRGLLHGPEVLLLDEPTSSLDPGARKDVWTYLDTLSQEGVTVLVTTHVMEEADRCTRLALFDEGRLVALDTPMALKKAIRGDVISVTSPDPVRLAKGILERFGCPSVIMDKTLRLERNEGHRFVPQLVEAFPGLVETLSVGKPSLDDVFVRHTGHRFWTTTP